MLSASPCFVLTAKIMWGGGSFVYEDRPCEETQSLSATLKLRMKSKETRSASDSRLFLGSTSGCVFWFLRARLASASRRQKRGLRDVQGVG